MLALLTLLPTAIAAPPDRDSELGLWAEAGAHGLAGPQEETSFGGGLGLNFGLALGRDARQAIGVEVHLREGFATADDRWIGGLSLLLRYPAGTGIHTGIGFAHHHEQGAARAREAVAETLFGTDEEINHRTGFEVFAGYDFPSTAPDGTFSSRLRPSTQLSAVVLPATDGPTVYLVGEFTIRLGLLRPVEPPTRTPTRPG